MKQFILLIGCIIIMNHAGAQKTSDILKQQAGQGVKEGAAVATESAANKVTDKVLNSIFSKKNKKAKKDESTEGPSTANTGTSVVGTGNTAAGTTAGNPPVNSSGNNSLQTYSKYDFVPGEKVLAYEDFSQDAVGDFPDKWNTNSAGEVVTVSDLPGKWLMLNKKGIFTPEFIENLPDNFTLEFDMVYFGSGPYLYLMLLSGSNEKALSYDVGKRSGVNIGIQPIPRDNGGVASINSYDEGNKIIDNSIKFQNNGATKIKVSIWRQKQRVRVYLDENKVFDLPKAFPSGKIYNSMLFETWSDFEGQDKYLVGNIKLAAGEPDTRNKLISEGKFSTTGILFDVNSASIKPESYGSLKDIADVLKGNPNVHVKIIGHTDSDGDATMNVTLSKKRAEAVKALLVNEFQIDESRLSSDGKGASEPAARNTTAEGKAQNRRVEFVKI